MDEASLQDLDLEGLLPPPRVGPGRQAAPLVAEFVRELTPADLAMPATVTQTPPAISKIRDSHHAVARMLATGSRDGDIAIATGYSASRISVLKADPQFQELVKFYTDTSTEVVADLRSRMAGMAIDALQEMSSRLNDDPEQFSVGQLNEVVKTMADRTGHAPQHGPQSKTEINITLVERMAKSRERIKALMSDGMRTIDHDAS
jgi:hypothetical protein